MGAGDLRLALAVATRIAKTIAGVNCILSVDGFLQGENLYD
jgi:hypothetical protein